MARTSTWSLVILVACIGLVACGGTEPPRWGGATTAPAKDTTTPPPDQEGTPPAGEGSRLDARVVGDERTVPREHGFSFADIVTHEDDLDDVWRRFGLADPPPDVDLDSELLLLVATGESGSCPLRFEGLVRDGDVVRIRLDDAPEDVHDPDDDVVYACTDDYVPRAFIVAVDRDAMPAGGFTLDAGDEGRFALASSPQREAHEVGGWLWGFGDRADAELVADPREVATGERVEVAIDNRAEDEVTRGDTPVLERWDRQRWLPAPGQEEYDAHPAIVERALRAPPGTRTVIVEIDTGELEPGWYAARMRLAGGGGGYEHRATFEVRGG